MGTNIATVIAFEVRRTLRTKAFWVAALLVPVAFAAIFFVMQRTTMEASGGVGDGTGTAGAFTFQYVDDSGLIDDAIAQAAGGSPISDPAQGLAQVEAGSAQAFIHWPADVTTQAITVAGQDVGLFDSDKYTAMAINVLQASAAASVGDPALVRASSGNVSVELTTYTDGKVSGGVGPILPPLVFLAALYLVILTQGNRMLSSSLEEKENRVTEMILTTINSRSLLGGKIVSLIVIGLVQVLITIVPVVVVVVVMRRGTVTGLLSHLEFDPQRMILGAALLLAGFLLFTGGCVAIGAAVPTVKDASSMFTVVVLVLLAPFFVISLVMSNPSAMPVQIMSYFPFTAPVTGMIRNAFGNLSWAEGLIQVAISLLFAWLVFMLAVRLYQYGSVEYDKKINLKLALQKA